MEIKSKQIVVTGANRGMGRAFAHSFAEAGAHLHLVNRKKDGDFEEELKKAGALSVTTWVCDLSKTEQVESLISSLQEVEVDILVNNAGLLTGGLIEKQSWPEIEAMFHVNLLSLVQLTRGLVPGMVARQRGKIVNNSSVSAVMHFPCASTYAASKAAVLAFSNCLREELKPAGVSVLTLITPGIKTAMFDQISDHYGQNFEIPTEAMPVKQYAQMVKEAILLDLEQLNPRGATGWGLKIAEYAPSLFRWEIQRRFRR